MTVSASIPTAKSRVLIAGATGFIGQFVAKASLDAGRPTYVLVRPGLAGCPSKSRVLKSLHDKGAIILHVCLIRLLQSEMLYFLYSFNSPL
jgi:leucoanthocyanidin reductase